MSVLTINYSQKIPTLSWLPYVGDGAPPSGYRVYWGPSVSGPWENISHQDILILSYQDVAHPLTTDRRVYWKVTAIVGGSEVLHAGPQTWEPMVRGRTKYILQTIQNRHALMLGFTAESCTIWVRRSAGTACSCAVGSGDAVRLKPNADYNDGVCSICYGTGIQGGYVKFTDVMVRVRSAQDQFELLPEGLRLTDGRTALVTDYPVLDSGDIFQRPNGERFIVTSPRRRETQGELTLQVLQVQQLEPNHPLQAVA